MALARRPRAPQRPGAAPPDAEDRPDREGCARRHPASRARCVASRCNAA